MEKVGDKQEETKWKKMVKELINNNKHPGFFNDGFALVQEGLKDSTPYLTL
jgi:hypothetical protein